MFTRSCSPVPRRAALATLLAGVAMVLHCGAALANQYHVFSCEDPYTGQGAPADDWTYDQGTNGYGDGAGSSCSGGGGAISAWLDGGVTHGFAEGGYATFNAPGAMTIAAFSLWRYEAAGPYQPFAAPADNIAYNPGNVSIEGLCAESLGCWTKGTNQARVVPANQVGASGLVGVTQIQASAVCGGGPGTSYVCPTSNAENGNSAEVDIYAADLLLNDPTVPSLSNVTGPLVSGATLSGNASISFTASDSGGPGIYSAWISVDGHAGASQILDTNGGACRSLGATSDGLRSFNDPQPCKPQVSATLTLNTATLSPGAHSVLVTVDDASGDAATVWDGTITVASPTPAVAPVAPAAPAAPVPNGLPACERSSLSVSVKGQRSRAVIRYGNQATVTGLLRCDTAPIASASVVVLGRGLSTTVVTAADGRFSYPVPAGPSRRLTFSYRAYSDDSTSSASARATILVIPHIKLRITPGRTHNDGTITWRGSVPDGPYPSSGVTLLVEVKEGRRWQPFDQVVAERGRFTYRYTFLRTSEPTTYMFRVALPAGGSAGYDYQPGGSNAIAVHVS